MIAYLGQASLFTALIFCVVTLYRSIFLNKTYSPIFLHIIFCAILTSFFLLVFAYVNSEFSIKNVYENSHSTTPLIYKITGVWGNHEGSMLLFILFLALFTVLFQSFSKFVEKNSVILVQIFLLLFLLCFLIFTSNPFAFASGNFSEGLDLNPLLQDIGLAMHPPLLYLGYVGFSLGFSFSITALLKNKVDQHTAICLRPWLLLALCFLTLGIALGSWWAYRELGWGGFWFWDPVENSSLMPWLVGVALIHSVRVLEVRNIFKNWVLFLGILTFVLSFLGFFLVRSGILSSVHSFASDPYRGIFMLAILFIIGGGGFLVFAIKMVKRSPQSIFFLSKESGIMFNNLFLLALLFIILLGTIYPIFMSLLGKVGVAIGTPYYHKLFNPVALFLVFLCSFGSSINWKKDNFRRLLKKYFLHIICASFFVFLLNYLSPQKTYFLISFFLAILLMQVLIFSFLKRILQFKSSRKIPVSFFSMFFAHFGLALLLFSITAYAAWKKEELFSFKKNNQEQISNFTVKLKNIKMIKKNNYIARRAEFSLSKNGDKELAALYPETRVYLSGYQKTTEAAIYSNLFYDFYVVIGDTDENGNIAVRLYYNPMINFIWLSSILIGVGCMPFVFAKLKSKNKLKKRYS